MMFFTIAGFLFSLLAPCALVVGIAILLQRRFANADNASLCPFIGVPIAVAALPLIYAYGMEIFVAFYGGNKFEMDAFHMRLFSGPYQFFYWANVLGLLSSQLFWIRRVRSSPVALALVGLLLLIPSRM